MLRDTVVRRLLTNASLKRTDAGAFERLVNAIVKDIDALAVKNQTLANRVWNRVEWKLPSRDFTTARTEVAVWKNMFYGVKEEVAREMWP